MVSAALSNSSVCSHRLDWCELNDEKNQDLLVNLCASLCNTGVISDKFLLVETADGIIAIVSSIRRLKWLTRFA